MEYKELRQKVKEKLEVVVEHAVKHAQDRGSNTVTKSDVQAGLQASMVHNNHGIGEVTQTIVDSPPTKSDDAM
jgi:hypothetical protein